MARTRHVGVLLVVATLLLWGGAAAATTSLSTGGGAVDTANTAQVQQQADENASVTFEDQAVENGTVVVANVTVPDGGYVTIHNDSLFDGDAVGSVVGVSDYLEPGTHENVSVTLYEGVPGADFENATAPTGTQTLVAMPHQETSDDAMGNETTTTTDNETTTENTTTTTTDNETTTVDNTTTTTADNTTTTTTENTTTTTAGNDTTTATTETTDNTTTADTTETTDTTDTTEEAENSELSVNAQQQNQTYDFVATDGQEDGPYTVDGAAVTDSAEVDFGQAEEPDDGGDDGDAGAGDGEDADAAAGNFTVSNLSAPELAAPNTTVTVTATLTNTGDADRSEDVAFRLAGDGADVVVYQRVSIDGDENETVTFEVNTSAVGEGEYIHGVTTANSSAFATIEVTNDSEVVFGDQTGEGDTVTVESVYVPEGGYVAIHNDSLLDGDAVGSVVGVSDYLDPGVHENVSVDLYEGVEGAEFAANPVVEDNAVLVAMPHMETTGDETYDFVQSEGDDDGPYVVDGAAVVDVGNLTITAEQSPSGGSEGPE